MKTPLISVIIPTRTGVGVLCDCLEALGKQTLASDQFEVIVVVNAPVMPKQLAQVPGVQYALRFIHEPIAGAARARNRGGDVSRGAYLAFLDDDAMPAADWLEKGIALFTAVTPAPLAVGGSIIPAYDTDKPDWFKDRYESFTFGDMARWLIEGESFTESNMIIRKEAYLQAGGFDQSTGMKGQEISSGEERRLFKNLWSTAGADVAYYSPDLQVYHHVPEYKMDPYYKLRRSFAYGQSWKRQHRGALANQLYHVVVYTGGFGVALIRALIMFPWYRNRNQWLYEQVGPIFFFVGYLLAVGKIHRAVIDRHHLL